MNGIWQHTLQFERSNRELADVPTERIGEELVKYLGKDFELEGHLPHFTLLYQSIWASPNVKIRVDRSAPESFSIGISYRTIDVLVVGFLICFLLVLIGRFQNELFWAIGLIVSIAYVFLHNFLIWSRIDLLFRKFPLYEQFSDEAVLLSKQENWAQQRSFCPGCGAPLSQYHEYCSSCGLRVNTDPKVYPVTISKHAHKGMEYTYKKSKRKKKGKK